MGALIVLVGVVTMDARPALACTCAADSPREVLEQHGTGLDTSDLVFVGSVADSGESDVTREGASRPPIPGVALLFTVDTVYVGEAGQTLVVHAPGGPPYSGNCSIGVPDGKQFVVAWKNPDGFLVSGMCGIFPIENAPPTDVLAEALGPPRPPSAELPAEGLHRGRPAVIAPEDAADRAKSQFLDSSAPSFVATGESQMGSSRGLGLAALLVVVVAVAGTLLRRRVKRSQGRT